MRTRCYVTEYHGNNRATFRCFYGHVFRMALMRRAPNGKLPAEIMMKKMAHWWGKHHEDASGGGCYMECPKCKRDRAG